jgi:hypothetical protein
VGHYWSRHCTRRARGDHAPSKRRDAWRARASYDHLGRGLGQAGQATGLQMLRPWAKCWSATVHCFSNSQKSFYDLNSKNCLNFENS